jgi:hypothetical protein
VPVRIGAAAPKEILTVSPAAKTGAFMPNNIAEAKIGKQIFEDNFIMHTLN